MAFEYLALFMLCGLPRVCDFMKHVNQSVFVVFVKAIQLTSGSRVEYGFVRYHSVVFSVFDLKHVAMCNHHSSVINTLITYRCI